MVGISAPTYSLEVHGHTKHTDRTKRIFHGAGAAVLNGATQTFTFTPYATLTFDAIAEEAMFSVVVPDDYLSAAEIVLVALWAGVAGTVMDVNCAWGGDDDVYNGQTEALADIPISNSAANDICFQACGFVFSGLGAGDLIGVKILYHTNTVYLTGIVFEYLGDM